MGEVLVLGGYGYAGAACVQELYETTSVRLVVAGRNHQRAERAALPLRDRARSAYADAADPRTLRTAIPEAAVVLCCAGTQTGAALQIAVQHRVPFVDLAPLSLNRASLATLREQAWEAQVPVVLHAGAVPGLPAVAADFLLRCFPRIARLEIASTGSWKRGRAAREGLAGLASQDRGIGRRLRDRARRARCDFPEPIGQRATVPARALELDGFEASHCLEELRYSEARPSSSQRWLRRDPPAEFGLVARAFLDPKERRPSGQLQIDAPNPLVPAAAVAGAVVRAILRGTVPAGLLGPHEALNPGQLLQVLAKRGVRVATDLPLGQPGQSPALSPTSPRTSSRSGRIPSGSNPPAASASTMTPLE